ncbi:hypothetical protein LIER_32945 [Lithospermum erythrorhizon]|uniref:Uncharacterized protein n=1 Tax=Lithospermum erythrorhizon TaxID=34254 RepID=A0AAV3RZB6_LITER
MTRERVPLFRRAKVVKKVSQDTGVTASHPSVALQPSSLSGKRPAAETRPPLFSKRQKFVAHKRPKSEILDLTEDLPISIPPERELPRESSSLNPSISESLPEEDADSTPKVTTGYSTNFLELPYTVPGGFQIDEESTLWRKQDAFRASRPLVLEQIGKDYDAIRDPLEVHGDVALHLIRVTSFLPSLSSCVYV